MSADRVRVRMYRQGLGDCFLLTFGEGADERHVLIDCGTLGATTTGVKLSEVVADIRATTGDHIHALVATHEHWDHVSGFGSLEEAFGKIRVDAVWLAWTEDPKDPLAQELAKTRSDLGLTVRRAAAALTASADPTSKALGQAAADVLGFFGADAVLGASDFAENLNSAMQFVRTGFGVTPRYFQPGQALLDETLLPGFRVYVLGPPRDRNALNDLGEHGSSQLYGVMAGLGTATRAEAAASKRRGANGTDGTDAADPATPFESRFRYRRTDPVIRRHLRDTYFNDRHAWRRIDDDWLHVTADLALQLDSATNNSSLALAFERVRDGKVFLFPGDAQEGNWLSWSSPSLSWVVPHAADPVTAADLIARTVFYKVGHHASHNGTVKSQGLELMKDRTNLTAFIPVDRAVALGRHPQGSWKMPARALYRRLLEQCDGRVLRSDLGWARPSTTAANRAVEQEFAELATAQEWTAWKARQSAATHVRITRLFAEFELR